MTTKEEVIGMLKKCLDPELHIDVWTLGLIYNIEINNEIVDITMTFTTPACPYGPRLLAEVKHRIESIESVKQAKIEVVFEPKWEPSEDLKAMLGI